MNNSQTALCLSERPVPDWVYHPACGKLDKWAWNKRMELEKVLMRKGIIGKAAEKSGLKDPVFAFTY